ncbi:nuclear transport factor 2 family protein [Roseomonas sp. OT10]|uniref:nuclear transport factor 2 family protein n=1 Tax=Roseomonas cutis TaxID=2897332 RepID=UPI001E3B9A41|nr:nuclear transport factor 2 family protein [Roseomonas sp. OT10]UFN50555.1 nuclear transport factor 2 family protein [Roseomonas sp. OT10]
MPTESDPTLPVQRQLDAYNARDIEAFMACWAEDCAYYGFPGQLLAQGAAAVRARHVERFREPDLHGRLLHRMAVGNLVTDHEVVTRNLPGGRAEVGVIALYEVIDGRIARAWFRMGEARPLPAGP